MSDRRCCCTPGTYTKLTLCGCTPWPLEPPAYVADYDPALGCCYIHEERGGDPDELRCWYVGPESPTKTVLDAGDNQLTGHTFVQVETPDLACCMCCECGESDPTPDSCFDAPAGGCTCCPGTNDGAQWIWTWQTSILFEARRAQGSQLRPFETVSAGGTIHWRNVAGVLCNRILSADLFIDQTKWDTDLVNNYYVLCSRSATAGDCSDVEDYFNFDATWPHWRPRCAERINVYVPGAPGNLQYWAIPQPKGGTFPCDFAHFNFVGQQHYGGGQATPWTTDRFAIASGGCGFVGKQYATESATEGSITFSGDCHRSRVDWDYTDTWTPDGIWERGTYQGFIEYQLAKPPCPGGCGARARFFGVGILPPAGGPLGPSSMWVPRSLGGLLS
jgi:hypothetical protein